MLKQNAIKILKEKCSKRKENWFACTLLSLS